MDYLNAKRIEHEEAGLENTHNDEGHEENPDPDCSICKRSSGGRGLCVDCEAATDQGNGPHSCENCGGRFCEQCCAFHRNSDSIENA